jgi:DNA-binding NtrC family response regulator
MLAGECVVPNSTRPLSVLLVDDEEDSRLVLSQLVEAEGCRVRCASSLAEARGLIESSAPDVVISDLMLEDGRGLDLVEQLQANPNAEVILVTGQASVGTAVEALRLGAHDYLVKPVDAQRLRQLLRGLRRTHRLADEVGRLKGELRRMGRFGPLVGSSPVMQQAYDLVERVAPSDATVLLIGESGTGKELVAQAIARSSRRADGPFVAVNCGAISATLIESELFGHEKGSFTGAERRHAGCFERASGGTLFLDEITEMTADLQIRLLRVLETSTVQRVGGNEPIKVDVRIIAATNRSPEAAVEDGKLREDLYYRLHVFPMRLPPLRERGSDVEILARHFVAELNRETGTDKRLAEETVAALRRHAWPGNVRELKNVIQQIHILADDMITPDLLPSDLHARQVKDGPMLHVAAGTPLADVERRLILATLEQLGGDKRETAQRLGIALRTLYNRLSEYNGATPAANVESGEDG